jgi:hypothetical protein
MKPLIARLTAEELSHRAHFFPLPLRPVNLRVQFDRTCPPQTYVRRRSNADKSCVGIFAALFDPGFHLGEVPDDAAGCKIETTGKFGAALHFVNRGVCKRYDQSEFVAAQRPSHAVE